MPAGSAPTGYSRPRRPARKTACLKLAHSRPPLPPIPRRAGAGCQRRPARSFSCSGRHPTPAGNVSPATPQGYCALYARPPRKLRYQDRRRTRGTLHIRKRGRDWPVEANHSAQHSCSEPVEPPASSPSFTRTGDSRPGSGLHPDCLARQNGQLLSGLLRPTDQGGRTLSEAQFTALPLNAWRLRRRPSAR
jgi:hypothetical protein